MNRRPIIGNTDNLQLLAELARKFLPMAEGGADQFAKNVDATRVRIRHFIQVQKDMKQLLRRGRNLPGNAIGWAIKSKADADFDEMKVRGEKESHLEGYREARQMEFLLKSVIKLAEGESDVSSNA